MFYDYTMFSNTSPDGLRIGEDRHVMTYCIAGGAQFNLVLSHIDHTDPSTWNQDTAMEDMRAYFEGWDST